MDTKQLTRVASKWIRKRGFRVLSLDVATPSRERPDIFAVTDGGRSASLEIKASVSDAVANHLKGLAHCWGVGDERWLVTTPQVLQGLLSRDETLGAWRGYGWGVVTFDAPRTAAYDIHLHPEDREASERRAKHEKGLLLKLLLRERRCRDQEKRVIQAALDAFNADNGMSIKNGFWGDDRELGRSLRRELIEFVHKRGRCVE